MKSLKTAAFVIVSTSLVAFAAQANDELFAKLDTNTDGVISKVEAQTHAQLSKVFDSLDLDKDGVLSSDEFITNGLKIDD